MNLLEQVAYHLEFCGFGTVATAEADGNIHWGRMPDQPDECICVFSYDTATPGAPQGARVQVINRAKSPRVAYETSANIARELEDFSGFLAGDGAMATITVENAATGIGADIKKRELYSSTFRMHYCE